MDKDNSVYFEHSDDGHSYKIKIESNGFVYSFDHAWNMWRSWGSVSECDEILQRKYKIALRKHKLNNFTKKG